MGDPCHCYKRQARFLGALVFVDLSAGVQPYPDVESDCFEVPVYAGDRGMGPFGRPIR